MLMVDREMKLQYVRDMLVKERKEKGIIIHYTKTVCLTKRENVHVAIYEMEMSPYEAGTKAKISGKFFSRRWKM